MQRTGGFMKSPPTKNAGTTIPNCQVGRNPTSDSSEIWQSRRGETPGLRGRCAGKCVLKENSGPWAWVQCRSWACWSKAACHALEEKKKEKSLFLPHFSKHWGRQTWCPHSSLSLEVLHVALLPPWIHFLHFLHYIKIQTFMNRWTVWKTKWKEWFSLAQKKWQEMKSPRKPNSSNKCDFKKTTVMTNCNHLFACLLCARHCPFTNSQDGSHCPPGRF